MLAKDINKFSCSLMSNAKWRKLFSVVNESNVEFTHCIWKLVGEESKKGFVPDFAQLGSDFVGDCGALNGPFEFKQIEWLLIPTEFSYKPYENAPTLKKKQDLSNLVVQLNLLGKFEFELNESGLKVIGYKP